MRYDVFESKMRSRECFTPLRLLPGAWTILRLDGQGFSRLTQEHYAKPFDAEFHEQMIAAARALVENFQGVYAHTQSDEISLLLRPDWELFDRRLEKILSLSAGIASAVFTGASGKLAQFDSRVWLGTEKSQVIDYFRWRQSDGERCALHGLCYWLLRRDGAGAQKATQTLEGKSVASKYELILEHGVNFKELPLWQRRGTGICWEEYCRQGYDPKKQKNVMATRRRLAVNREIPIRDAYAQFLDKIIGDR